MSLRYAAHLRMGNTVDGHYAMLCTHCGGVYVPRLPISMDMLIVICNQFANDHMDCPCATAGPFDEASLLARANSLALLVR